MTRHASGLRLAAAALLMASPALAQTQTLAPEAVERVEATIARAIEEWRVLVNCAATEPTGYDLIVDHLRSMRAETEGWLASNGFSREAVADFEARSDPDGLLMAATSFGEVVAFCRDHPDWLERQYRFEMVLLPRDLEAAVAAHGP